MRRFGLKTGIHFAHFGLESGMVFEACMNVSEIGSGFEELGGTPLTRIPRNDAPQALSVRLREMSVL